MTPEPLVRLVNAFRRPFDTVVATARTCYSSRVVTPEECDKDDRAREVRDRVYESIYKAGHHTTIQHATFQFALERVSRQFIWSFLHAHPFYNSEQVSQRYVEVKPGHFATPPLPDKARDIYDSTIRAMMDGYVALMEALEPDVEREYLRLYPARRSSKDEWKGAIHKRTMEAARYVLPVATHAHLYHTVSGLTLHRYHRLCHQLDAPTETRLVVGKMIDEVNRLDPLFFKSIEDEIPIEETPEYRAFVEFHGAGPAGAGFAREFDAQLGPLRSKLVDWKIHAPETMAQAVRDVLGLTRDRLSDEDAIERVMNPAMNPLLGESLVLTTHSKLSRAMHHPHYTFKKKLSHTADSQDQRHRMTPATRPVLAAHFRPEEPDVIFPPILEGNAGALERATTLLREVWRTINRLREMGVAWEFAEYLLPNAVAVRFEESGDLLNLHHKWTTRLCYLAQEEIWRCCLEEVRQVAAVHPSLARHLLPPCGLRKEAGSSPYCPEGDRYCGVPVWTLPREKYERAI
ncbi:MAG: FAD-dependent thymidylate synthase [Planctomycetes bacterium]|nr:FAD-dependent thymidylate synthase [Planctomycetota bacterium]